MQRMHLVRAAPLGEDADSCQSNDHGSKESLRSTSFCSPMSSPKSSPEDDCLATKGIATSSESSSDSSSGHDGETELDSFALESQGEDEKEAGSAGAYVGAGESRTFSARQSLSCMNARIRALLQTTKSPPPQRPTSAAAKASIKKSAGKVTAKRDFLTVPASFTSSDCSSPASEGLTESPTSTRTVRGSAMQIIREALEKTANTPDVHPFLDLRQQRESVAAWRHQRHVEHYLLMTRNAALHLADQQTAAKILCHEAHRLQVRRAVTFNQRHSGRGASTPERTPHTPQPKDIAASWASRERHPRDARCQTPPPQHAMRTSPLASGATPSVSATTIREKDVNTITMQWRRIKGYVETDLEKEGYPFIQRRLSCMCMFNSQCDDRPYCDNEQYREARQRRQLELLMRLDQQELARGNPFFLEDE